jgi:hypothetical protein
MQQREIFMPRFRGNVFYVVQRQGTTAIPSGDFHNDLHRSVQNAPQRELRCQRSSPFFAPTSSTLKRHRPDTDVIYFSSHRPSIAVNVHQHCRISNFLNTIIWAPASFPLS